MVLSGHSPSCGCELQGLEGFDFKLKALAGLVPFSVFVVGNNHLNMEATEAAEERARYQIHKRYFLDFLDNGTVRPSLGPKACLLSIIDIVTSSSTS